MFSQWCFSSSPLSRPQSTSSRPISTEPLRKSQSSLLSGTGWTNRCTLRRFAQRGCCWTCFWRPTCERSLKTQVKHGALLHVLIQKSCLSCFAVCWVWRRAWRPCLCPQRRTTSPGTTWGTTETWLFSPAGTLKRGETGDVTSCRNRRTHAQIAVLLQTADRRATASVSGGGVCLAEDALADAASARLFVRHGTPALAAELCDEQRERRGRQDVGPQRPALPAHPVSADSCSDGRKTSAGVAERRSAVMSPVMKWVAESSGLVWEHSRCQVGADWSLCQRRKDEADFKRIYKWILFVLHLFWEFLVCLVSNCPWFWFLFGSELLWCSELMRKRAADDEQGTQGASWRCGVSPAAGLD